ncbi:FG-GAP repeat protein [Urechidicola vernalis]|uniref:FG-GAP repeat protein n=1 Tax=Urechidicola vernalis TaxID=3075600 RepID=A0ABU2Y278_9FLAO|nr:FG-GAP repeat protein [Urechidicola sp. P050]MDT0552306.1 FG-GAP repeat protein [Urechidicola sp. P050]
MNSKVTLKKFIIPTFILAFTAIGYSQKVPVIKHLDEETIDEIKIDFDKDGDLDVIVAGVFVKKNQGRVYMVKNNSFGYSKPEYLFSFPTIGRKQEISINQSGDLTKITVLGTSPTGKQNEFNATLLKGRFEGVTIPAIPISIDH